VPLSEQQRRFIDAYLVSLNATQAAIDAGYSPKTARVQGSRLLTSVDIAAELAKRRAVQVAAADLSAIRVLEELRRVAMVDARSFFHADGSAKRPHELTPEQGPPWPALKCW
jgi:phage terminase small subunit